MAALNQSNICQKYVEVPGANQTIGIHVLTLQSSSDTFTVPALANSTSAASAAHLRRTGQSAATVTYSGYTVTVAGTAGEEVVIVTLHTKGKSNYIPEA